MNALFSKKSRLYTTPIFVINDDNPVIGFSQTVDWGLMLTKIQTIHEKGITGKNIKVAVIDTRVDADHPDLSGAVKGSYNVTDDESPSSGHGCAVAGVIAAQNNDTGVLGVAPGVHIYGIKMLSENGGGSSTSLLKALRQAESLGVDIVNMSLGAPNMARNVAVQITKMIKNGIIIIAAAGNTGKDNNVMYPAKLDGVIAVGAINRNREVSSFSSKGDEIDIAAPGEKILTTWKDGGYTVISGTSFSGPFISGVAALCKQVMPNLTPKQFQDLLQRSALDIDSPGKDSRTGYGLVNPTLMVGLRDDSEESNKVLDDLINLGKSLIINGNFTKEELLKRLD